VALSHVTSLSAPAALTRARGISFAFSNLPPAPAVLLTRNYPGLFTMGLTELDLEEVGLSEEAKSALIVPSRRNPALR
jgi:hypothetical protein